MRVGLVQLCSSDDPRQNLNQTIDFLDEAQRAGADFIATPEVTNCVSTSRALQSEVLVKEGEDQTLRSIKEWSNANGVWVLIGSLALKSDANDGRFVNRSFLIAPSGEIAARYDKIHMFDVQVSATETYRESDGYRSGSKAVVADAGDATIGLTVCYDLRFPQLYQTLARTGANVLTVPSAFSTVTGAAHWHTLLRARAIECGAFVLAPAQTGVHQAAQGKRRQTYGHSLAVDPWGKVLADGGELPGVTLVDIDPARAKVVRAKIPSLEHHRNFDGP